MNPKRLAAIGGVEFGATLRRPLFIMASFMLVLTAFGLASGSMTISSGETSVGGTKAWITSLYAQTQTFTYLTVLILAWFVAIAAGMTLLRDRETNADVLLHATPLSPSEYVWGRFLAIVAGFAALLCLYAAAAAVFNHAVPNAGAVEIRGPFAAANYFLPVLTIGLPFVIFFAGVSLYVGERTRSSILVFVLPLAVFLICGFFLFTWSPSWLDPNVNRLLQVIEPSGYRWLNETHLKVDRGVAYYNTAAVEYDAVFWLNRLWLLATGLGAVLLAQRSMARAARGAEPRRTAAQRRDTGEAKTGSRPGLPDTAAATAGGIPAWAVGRTKASFAASVRTVAGAELREIARQRGLIIFVPIILFQALGTALVAVGAFDTPILLTPGTFAVAAASQMTFMVCALLMFYTIESLERDRTTGVAAILYSTPLRTGALLLGKAAANLAVAGIMMAATLLAGVIALAVQKTVPFSIGPFALVWGGLLLPTFLAWIAFVTAAYAWTGNRYAAYGIALGVLFFTGFRVVTSTINWAGNWGLFGALRWTDLGPLELDAPALVWNRIMVLGAAVFFAMLAVRLFARRGGDAVRTLHALSPRRLGRSVLRLLPAAAVPVTACVVLIFLVHGGIEGGTAEKARKDYWAKNVKTWANAPLPDIARADVDLRIDPPRRRLASEGRLTLVNRHAAPMARIPLTGGLHWDSLRWTMNGAPCTPEDRKGLYVFTPLAPLATGDSVVVGWRWNGRFPDGVTKNGGNVSEFVLRSGVVLTGFSPSFMPVLGFMEDIGITKENRTDPREYPDDWWKGETRAAFGVGDWFPARVTITAPREYTLNSDGVCTSNTVRDGWRTQVWETDHPVKLLNVVCGRWEERRGESTTIFYDARHPYNVEEMSATLDAARRWYSEWFLPYPWRELKLSEFPGLAGYAQGFGTNITFSENIGFLTRNDEKTNATFLVTAHEAAHQWWGNILTPADGPGGDILSEGMSHFSTLLLFEKVKGSRARMEFAKGIESRYADRRRPDDERPLYRIDGKRASDETVTYDRGGWVFWMLYDFMGHDRALEGYRSFIRTWSVGRDHPALEDFVAAMRPYAADAAAYDDFVTQWFEDKAMPEYRITKAAKSASGNGYEVTVTVENRGTGRMPVEIAATAGERWSKPARTDAASDSTAAPAPGKAYREARTTLTLDSGGSKRVTIHCPFDPKQVVIDPDVRVLQLNRKLAAAAL